MTKTQKGKRPTRVASVKAGTKAIGLPGQAEFEGSPYNYIS